MSRNDNGWAEHGGYMAAKKNKLNQQFLNGSKKQLSDMFSGVCIFIDGYTEPTDDEIKDIMHLHGGRFCHYYSRDVVTHIIANNLPQSKINKLSNEKIVTPDWVVKSVEAGKLLNWSNYELYSERHKSNQNIMKNFIQTAEDNGKEIDTGAISLSDFYAKSRLHHLSMWSSELSRYLNDLKAEVTDSELIFPGRSEFIDYYNTMSDKNIIITSETLLMHVDMDCFFVSVGIRDQPDLIGKPVVVTHSTKGLSAKNSTSGSMSEIASCSYEAREYGIKNGMLLGKAQTLCQDLIMIPYNFQGYLEVAKVLYKTASRFTHDIEVGSCDELYLNLSDILKPPCNLSDHNKMSMIDPLIFAEYLRSIIKRETRCAVSCGIGSNLLICKLATKKAKPDGKFWLKTCGVEEVINGMNIRDLPGIGRVLEYKLNQLNINNCADLQLMSLDKLKCDFGLKLGQRLHNMCRGKDSRVIRTERIRKSISAEINYGIRLHSMEECNKLFEKLSTELSRRLELAQMTGSFLVLKLMVRHPDASVESVKYLGHGFCNNFSKSVKIKISTNKASDISNYTINLFKQFKIDVKELRGVGLVMQKLVSVNKLLSASKSSMNIANYFSSNNCSGEKENNDQMNASIDCQDDDVNDCTIIDSQDDDVIKLNDHLLPEEYANDISNHCTRNSHVIIDSQTDKQSKAIFEKPELINKNKKKKVIKSKQQHQEEEDKVTISGNQLTIVEMLAWKPEQRRMRNDRNNDVICESNDTDTINFLARLGNTSIETLEDAVTKWVETEFVPDNEDAYLIRYQMAQMVFDNAPGVARLLMHLRYVISVTYGGTQYEQQWISCYDNIETIIQQLCFNTFGEMLILE